MDHGSLGVGNTMWLGLDPGRYKTGWAFVSFEGALLQSGIVLEKDFFVWKQSLLIILEGKGGSLDSWVRESSPSPLNGKICKILLGNGTSSSQLQERFSDFPLKIEVVPEQGTTLEARSLYWKLHPPRGWRRFLPRSLQVPPRDVDDLAAWAIVLRHMRTLNREKSKDVRRSKGE